MTLNDHPYSVNSGFRLFFETTRIGKNADMTVVQKAIIDTLHKEGKSQKVIPEGVAVYRVHRVSKHNKCKVDWKEEMGRKRCTSNRDDEYCQAKPVQTLGRASQGVDRSWRLLKQKHRQKHLTWAKEENKWTVAQWSKVIFTDKSTFCISFVNQGLESGGRLESRGFFDFSDFWAKWILKAASKDKEIAE